VIDSSDYGCVLKLFYNFFCFVCVGECTPYSDRDHVSGENEEVYSCRSTISVDYMTDYSFYIVEMKVITLNLIYGYVIFQFY
jgi:hypothetical protein